MGLIGYSSSLLGFWELMRECRMRTSRLLLETWPSLVIKKLEYLNSAQEISKLVGQPRETGDADGPVQFWCAFKKKNAPLQLSDRDFDEASGR